MVRAIFLGWFEILLAGMAKIYVLKGDQSS